MRHRLVLTVMAALLTLGGAASAQSPSPASSASATPFPLPTIPAPADDPNLPAFDPTGRPDARGRRFGVITELWLSSPTVGQGEWVQAHVRVTNTRDDAVWGPGGCSLPTHVSVDLSGVYGSGATWEGNAAAFKRRAIRDRHLLSTAFEARGDGRRSSGAVTSTALALLDCGGTGSDVARLGPGQVLDVDYAWYPRDTFDVYDQWVRPLPPGTATVAASYDYIDHGARPGDNSKTRPVAASTTLELTGEDPGIPSPLERIDAALADPTFAAWVAADPTRRSWTGTYSGGWPGPGYPPQQRYAGTSGRAPYGIAELWLVRDLPGAVDSIGAAMVDPWTGEVLGVAFQCADGPCPDGLPGDPTGPAVTSEPSAAASPAAP